MNGALSINYAYARFLPRKERSNEARAGALDQPHTTVQVDTVSFVGGGALNAFATNMCPSYYSALRKAMH